jgi:hypothetical protein
LKASKQTMAEAKGKQFITLDMLLWQGVTILNLVTAIEQKGIYIWDRFDRLTPATDADKGSALELLGQQYDWMTDPQAVERMPISPLEMAYANKHSGDDDRYNPFDDFGWPKNVLPEFDKIQESIATDSGTAAEETPAERRAALDITTMRGCPRLILECWDDVEKLHGQSADGRQVQKILKRNLERNDEGPTLKTIQNSLRKLRLEKLIP